MSISTLFRVKVVTKATIINYRAFKETVKYKKDIDELSTIYCKIYAQDIELILYDHGYVLKLEGDIKKAIKVINAFDNCLSIRKEIFISPSQRISNNDEQRLPRSLSPHGIAFFLDNLFKVKDYTEALEEE